MLDLKLIVAEPELVKASLRKRGAESVVPEVDRVLKLNVDRKNIVGEVEALKHQRNEASAEIAKSKKEGKSSDDVLRKMKEVSQKIKDLDQSLSEVELNIKGVLQEFPNILNESVPEGRDENANKLIREWGEPKKFGFEPKSHFDILEGLGQVDFKKAGDVTGSRFAFLKGGAAQLERALIQFMIQQHLLKGYEEIMPPYMVNRDSLFGTGQLPKFEDDVFHIEKFDFFLSPTAEVPITNYHRGEILSQSELPKKYVAFSPCFRSEAGSYGKDTKGLKRQHQFHKVELVKFSPEESSFDELEGLTADAERILQLLGLPYRVMMLCGGDTGFGSTKTYDIEVWSPYSNSYMEISSCSNCLDFQARRANIRYRDSGGKVKHVHTLNGSGLAVGRSLIAIVENFQKEDGTYQVPEVLLPYMPQVP